MGLTRRKIDDCKGKNVNEKFVNKKHLNLVSHKRRKLIPYK